MYPSEIIKVFQAKQKLSPSHSLCCRIRLVVLLLCAAIHYIILDFIKIDTNTYRRVWKVIIIRVWQLFYLLFLFFFFFSSYCLILLHLSRKRTVHFIRRYNGLIRLFCCWLCHFPYRRSFVDCFIGQIDRTGLFGRLFIVASLDSPMLIWMYLNSVPKRTNEQNSNSITTIRDIALFALKSSQQHSKHSHIA